MKSTSSALTPAKIQDYARRRLIPVFEAPEVQALQDYLTGLLARHEYPPYRGSAVDLTAVAAQTGVDVAGLRAGRLQLQPICDAVARAVAEAGLRPVKPSTTATTATVAKAAPRPKAAGTGAKRGPKPKAIVEFPEPLAMEWEEPEGFGAALQLHVRRHGETLYHLFDAVVRPEDGVNRSTLISWGRGAKVPRASISQEILGRVERRYRLPQGYFASKVGPRHSAPGDFTIEGASSSERRRLAWHLPDDFNRRSSAEQAKILDWVRRVIVSGSTDYRKYQTAALRHTYALRFGCVAAPVRKSTAARTRAETGTVLAPAILDGEMEELLRFKTATFAAFDMQRSGVWGPDTADQKVEHFGLWFGALVAPPDGEVQGFGVDPKSLTFALMAFPQVWDWYLQWRERRRGFYTRWEVDLLANAAAFCRETTGWLRQSPRLARNLRSIPGMITEAEIAAAQADWAATCEAMHSHARRRIKEIQRVARVHRDPFEPILPVLEAASPLGEYRKITEVILSRIPDERHNPLATAETVRAFLLLRIGLHTGLRQKNLRELLLAKPGSLPTPERKLEDLKCGELRWSSRDHGWEILIPSVAFKNANSSFFGSKPFRLILPDLGRLYEMIAAWTERHRAVLIGPAQDPGTFFVKTAKTTTTRAAYCQNTFYEAWRSVIQRYGIYNPWTKRGAIEGLLPHGPHNVRDVLATHILKQTGSYEQASYAIQDTPEMVAEHYGRFLPQDKAEIAARVLNQVWQAA